MEEKMIRQSQERVRNQSSNISNTDTSDHVQLKRQNMPLREDDHVEANNDGALEIDVNSPFAKEAAALTAIIILLFTIDFKGYSMLYPLCNTAFTSSIIIWLILTHSLHLYLEEYRNNQGIIEYYVPIWKKYLFLYAHITRCGFSLISTAQTIYFLIISTHQILFHLITAMLIIHFCCAFVHLYFAAKNRFALSFKPNGST
ncbi:hypothetical protein DINM_006023 [Dirofilaria immitis]|nr:hypothetical protein [Dirofilaria immitis]